jgi:hypothetical protein
VTSRPHLSAAGDSAPRPEDALATLWDELAGADSIPVAAGCVVDLLRTVALADGAGLLVRDEQGRSTRLAARGPLVDDPGPDAASAHAPWAHPLADGGVLGIDDTHGDATWPGWSAAAVRRGVRSAWFVGLPVLRGRPVTLELYARRPHAFDAAAARLIADAARSTGAVLRQVARAADLEQEAQTRELIGRATGILMERYHLSAERSQGYLVRSSARAKLELSDLAREIVAAQDRAATRIRASSEDAGPSRG